MTEQRRRFGAEAESLVATWLSQRGFSILERNARAGRYEIDVIAKRPGLLVFVEVRARSSADFGHPSETISARKQASVREGARRWLQAHHDQRDCDVRFDVAAIVQSRDEITLDYYENAF